MEEFFDSALWAGITDIVIIIGMIAIVIIMVWETIKRQIK